MYIHMYTNIMTYMYYVDINVIYHYLLYIGKLLSFTRKNIFSETQRRSKAWREETVEIQMKRKVLFVFDNRQLVKWIAQSLLTCARVHFNYVGIMLQWSPRGGELFECSFVLKIIRLRYKYSISYCTFTCVLVVCSIRQSSEGSLRIFQTPSPISLKGLWIEETRKNTSLYLTSVYS